MRVPNARIIFAPDTNVMEMLRRRMPSEVRNLHKDSRFDAVALIQASIPNIFYFADLAQKAGAVYATELSGCCPQHISILAIFGDVAAVQAAVIAIESKYEPAAPTESE